MADMSPTEARSHDKQAPPRNICACTQAHSLGVETPVCRSWANVTSHSARWPVELGKQRNGRSIFNAPERQLETKLVRQYKHKLRRKRRRRLPSGSQAWESPGLVRSLNPKLKAIISLPGTSETVRQNGMGNYLQRLYLRHLQLDETISGNRQANEMLACSMQRAKGVEKACS